MVILAKINNMENKLSILEYFDILIKDIRFKKLCDDIIKDVIQNIPDSKPITFDNKKE